MDEIRHTFQEALGAVNIDVEELAKGGVKITISVRRPRQEGESFLQAAVSSADLAREAYDEARERFPVVAS